MANHDKISHSLHALRRSSSQTPVPQAPLKRPDRTPKAALKAPDSIKSAFKAPERIWQSLRAPEKSQKPRPTAWRPAGVAAASTRPEARPPWSPNPEPAASSGARRYRPGLDGLRALAV